jgi:hypothetical protein
MKPVSIIAATSLWLAAGAPAGGPEPSGAAPKIAAVKLEAIQGSTAKRVTLTEKAAQRLGIEIGRVGEEPIVRRLMVSGLVVSPSATPTSVKPATTGFASFSMNSALASSRQPLAVPARTAARKVVPAVSRPDQAAAPAASPEEVWVLVTLSRGEWEKLAKDKPVRILPLKEQEGPAKQVVALPSGLEPVEDAKRAMLTLRYLVAGKDHGLELNKRVRVELQQAGSEEKRKVVPYAAVYYDSGGATWAYVNPEPLVFERRRIGIERIQGDLAVLSEGPSVGTQVVVVGAPLLYGAEIFGK